MGLVKEINESAGQALSKLGEVVDREIPEEEKETVEPGNRIDDMERWLHSIRAQIREINSCLDKLNQRFDYSKEVQTVCEKKKSNRMLKGV